MYLRTKPGLGTIIGGSDLMRMRSGPQCTGYVTGELGTSRTMKGHLSPDVSLLDGRLLIADFGVNRSIVKSTTKMEKLLKDWLSRFETDSTYRLRILGYSDCVGMEKTNTLLRKNRAQQVYQLLGKSARSRVVSVGAAPLGTYVPGTDNTTVEGRAKNRSAIIEFWQEITFEPEVITGRRPIPAPSEEKQLEEKLNRILITPVPTLPRGKSLEDWLGEVLAGIPGGRTIRDKILSGGCTLLETIFTKAGGTLSEKQKEDLRKQCREGAKKPIR